jgi:predicted GIY-YIG superfamily endonuclease
MVTCVTVYIFQCKDGTHYCGITANLLRRTLEHVHTPKHYMKHHPPRRLLYAFHAPDYHTAAILERSIKRHGIAKFIRAQYAAAHIPIPLHTTKPH